MEITSGLRYLNSVDEEWDGSSYSGVTRAVIANTTAINNINHVDDSATLQEYYSTSGIKSNSPYKGFNIIRMSDGSIKKVMVK